ncbi:hypothetical protein ACFL3X_01410 [Gemmatimonadota bacterium]
MQTISKVALQRLIILSLVEAVERGIYGRFRIQKLIYLLEHDSELRPFEYVKNKAGPFSQDIADRRRELVEANLLEEQPMPGGLGGWVYSIPRELQGHSIGSLLKKCMPDVYDQLHKTVGEYGYMKNPEIQELVYATLSTIQRFIPGILVLSSNMESQIQIPDLNNEEHDDLEDLEFLPSAQFKETLKRFKAIDQPSIEFDITDIPGIECAS